MSEVAQVRLLAHNIFKQRDSRDPLGIWAFRSEQAGTATGGVFKVQVQSDEVDRIFTCVGLNLTADGITVAVQGKYRLLCNQPPADLEGGQAGVSIARNIDVTNFSNATAPADNWDAISPYESQLEHILLFGGVQSSRDPQNILEMECGGNALTVTYFFEATGYFWDRQILESPGGPRWPGM